MGCGRSAPNLPLQQKSFTPSAALSRLPTRRSSLLATKLNSITEKYQIINALGSDSMGTLFNATENLSGGLRTIREINKFTISKGVELFLEFTLLKELDHPNIVKIIEACETSKYYYIVMENISGGSLLNKFKKIGHEKVKAKYMLELFTGLNYLHSTGIVHCNVCTENVLLSTEDEEAIVKIIGFSCAQKEGINKELDLTALNQSFISPEILKGQFSLKSDVWSAGILLYQLLTARVAINQEGFFSPETKTNYENIDFTNMGFTILTLPAQDLIKSMLRLDPAQRPSFEDLLRHPWLQDVQEKVQISYNLAKRISCFKIHSHLGRCILSLLSEKLMNSKNSYTLVQYFRSFDMNNDGKVSRDEILEGFLQAGIENLAEIDLIMENLDYDSSGFIDFSELILALTDWKEQLKKKSIRRVFMNQDGKVPIIHLLEQIPEPVTREWQGFLRMYSQDNQYVLLADLKKYLKSQIVF